MIRSPRVASAVVAALAVAEAAVLLLRPRDGVIEPVHVEAESYFTAAQIERARAYRRPQLALFAAGTAIEAGALAALARRPPGVLRGPFRRPAAAAAVAGAVMSLALAAGPPPQGGVSPRGARRVGLATQGWDAWAADVARGWALGAVFAGAGASATVALMGRFPRGWWIGAAGLAVGFAAAALFLGPVVIDPIFNRFTPLEEGPTRSDVLALARAAGVDVGEVYVADASRRTTAVNAYVTGLGATKRVVLFDTLLDEGFSRDEVRLVVAHELAHVHYRDVRRGLLFVLVVAPVTTWAAAEGARVLAPGETGPAALPALALASGAAGVGVGVIANQLSRAIERRADSFSLRQTGGVEPFIGFETGIVVRNVAEPEPPRLVQALLGTHPTTVERIGIAKAYEAGAR
ncbi:MAG: M48 family metalloprotease [Solirubrobacteraceae bacterium]